MDSLSVKYRPKDFDDVVSQESIVKILERQLQSNEIHNTYLFCGASGCGKTTCARIFASKVNNIPYQKNMPGVIEIDAASNNGVDNIRDIVKSAQERSIETKYKIYILDECHALTNQSWQAFLKCIEEPPYYTIFIFCTTDPQKIPQTILNRCMRFNFTRISSSMINKRLNYICKQEGFENYSDACDYISRISNGGMRDAISLLEKCAGYSNDININNCLQVLGAFSYDDYFTLINKIIDGHQDGVIAILSQIYAQGFDMKLFVNQFLDFILDLAKYAICRDIQVTKIPINLKNQLDNATNFESCGQYYNYVCDRILELKTLLKDDDHAYTTIMVCFLRITRCQ